MSTYDVIWYWRGPGQLKERPRIEGLTARVAARAAVRAVRDGGDAAFVVPAGASIANPAMHCKVSLRTRRPTARARRTFVACTPTASFKKLLQTPRAKPKRRRRAR
jgi:hypothetical protein